MVVEAILSMPENTHLAVRKTCISLLGELCEWIERHGECLEPCLQFLLRALHNKHLACAAASALQVSRIVVLVPVIGYRTFQQFYDTNCNINVYLEIFLSTVVLSALCYQRWIL